MVLVIFLFLPCFVIFALNYASVTFDICEKNGVWAKTASITDPSLRYMYIAVQCGLSSKADTHHIKYHFCSIRLSFVVSQYWLCTLWNSHYFLLRMLLPYDMNQLYMVAGSLKYTKALYESFTLGNSHHSLWLMLLFYDTNRRCREWVP